MGEGLVLPLAFAAAVGAGLMAGFFFAFSVSVMGALRRVPAEQGIAAMQQINVVVLNPVFLAVFFGAALLSLASGVASFLMADGSGSTFLLAGGSVYILGSFLVTVACNVPRNDALAAVDPSSEEGAALWAGYLKAWTMWNHVRMIASLAAAVLFTAAVRTVT